MSTISHNTIFVIRALETTTHVTKKLLSGKYVLYCPTLIFPFYRSVSSAKFGTEYKHTPTSHRIALDRTWPHPSPPYLTRVPVHSLTRILFPEIVLVPIRLYLPDYNIIFSRTIIVIYNTSLICMSACRSMTP